MLINVIYVATSQELDVKCSSVFALEKSPPGKDVIYGFPVWSFGLLVKTWSSFFPFLFFHFLPSFPTNHRPIPQLENSLESATRGNLMGNCDWPSQPEMHRKAAHVGRSLVCAGVHLMCFSICVMRTLEFFFIARQRKKPKYHVILRFNKNILAVEVT